MKVYYMGTSINHRMMVQPAVDEHECAAWREADGRPKLFEIHFKNGVAEVEDNLGAYLIDKKLASKSKLILPPNH